MANTAVLAWKREAKASDGRDFHGWIRIIAFFTMRHVV
jgi:hypothetical protein